MVFRATQCPHFKPKGHCTVGMKKITLCTLHSPTVTWVQSGKQCDDDDPALDEFVEWCDMSFLELNVMKTKEMVFDFRTHKDVLEATLIHDQEVEVVSQYKYLGTVMDDKLRWDANTEAIAKKGQQRLYFLQKLNSFSVDTKFLTLFYKSFIESIVTFSFICWFRCLSVKNKNSLQKIVNVSSKVIGEPQRNLQTFF